VPTLQSCRHRSKPFYFIAITPTFAAATVTAAADRGTARKSESSVLRILFVLLGIVGLFVSFVNGWMFGIIASVILILLAAVAK